MHPITGSLFEFPVQPNLIFYPSRIGELVTDRSGKVDLFGSGHCKSLYRSIDQTLSTSQKGLSNAAFIVLPFVMLAIVSRMSEKIGDKKLTIFFSVSQFGMGTM